MTEPITVLPPNWAKTGCSGEFFGVAVILYELAPLWLLHCTTILLDVTINTEKVVSDGDREGKRTMMPWAFFHLISRIRFLFQLHIIYHVLQHRSGKKDKTQHINKNKKAIYFPDKDTIPWVKLLVFDIISWGKLCHVSYSLCIGGSRLHITFTQHRFQDWSVQVFLSGRNEFVYWAKAGHATRTCWKV